MRLTSFSENGPSGKALLKLTAAVGLSLLTFQGLPVEAQSFTVNTVSIEGNQRIETATILSYLGIAQGETVSAAELNDASQRIRATGLFETVEVEPRGGQLVITVSEYPTVYRINFEGNSRLKDDELFALLSSQERRIYSPSSVEADVADITAAYAEKGRINAIVTPRIIRLPDNRVNVVFEIAENGVTEVERIGFSGNRSFSDRRLRGVLATKQAGILRAIIGRDTYVADRIDFDKRVLTDFYQSRGYVDFAVRDVNVELTRERDAYLITFDVEEGQKFDFGAIDVISEIPEANLEEFQEAVRTRSGSTYTPLDIENDVARLERLALQRGLQFVQVEPRITRNDRDLTLDVTYALVRGERIFVERIDVEGNNTTLDRVVRQQFREVEGDPFNPRSIRETAERIRALGFFANADVQARRGSSDDQVVIDVNVAEAPTGSLSFGANFNTDTGLGLLASFRQQNFLGRGQALSLQFSTAETNKYFTLNFDEPYVLGRDLAFGLDMSYGATNNESARYDTETFTIRPSLTFSVSENGRLQTYVQSRYADIMNVTEYFNGSTQIRTPIDDDGDRNGEWTQSVGYTYTWDTRRSGLDENRGVILRFGQEYGFGDTTFIKTTATAGAEAKVLAEEVTLRATIEGGHLAYLDGSGTITDRFFLSGRQMRGFDLYGMGPRYIEGEVNDPLGGNSYAVARLEAEFPIGLPDEYGIHGGAFIDYGSLWDPGVDCSDANVHYCDFTPRAVAGVSLFWDTPVGPLRFNFTDTLLSEDLDEAKSFDVTISTSF
ncbi:outer membrane protein assembly factor BamA [Paradonghicola geojensis]|nr:outer membrane protein assembly factor BamA [Marivivens geojensis]